MDEVAATAGTTKPTVYAHFKSKEELFSAVIQFLREMFQNRMGIPDQYGDDPIEAIARYCSRIMDLCFWQDGLGFQRVVIANASRSPEMAGEVYNALFGSAVEALGNYLEQKRLAKKPREVAELILISTVGMPLLRYLYGIGLDQLPPDLPGDDASETRYELSKLRETVSMFIPG